MQNPLPSQQKPPQNKIFYHFQIIIHSWQSRFPAWILLLALILLGITFGMKNDLAYSDNRKVSPNPVDKSRSVDKSGKNPQNTISICCQPNQQEVILLPHRILSSSPNTQGIQMKEDNISVNVKDQVAITTLDQSFVNTSNRTLEARYLFPLPADANFSSFTLSINGKVVEGEVMEKNVARQTYQQIVQKMIDPGLLEYIDAQTVQVSVAPILPGEVKKIHLSYTQLLKQDGGLYKYQYALGNESSSSKLSRSLQNGENIYSNDYKSCLSLSLTTQQPLKTIYSPSHTPVIQRKDKNQASITLDLAHSQGASTSANSQPAFVLYFSEDQNLVSVNHLIYKKSATEDGYFLMTLRSPLENNPKEKIAKNLVLTIDTSGSMAGEKIQQARKALLYVLNHLQPEDHFNVVQFNTDVSSFRPELVPATHDNIEKALQYVEGLTANGSTNIEEALKTSCQELSASHSSQSEVPNYLILLTDGEPTVGVTDTPGLIKIAEKVTPSEAKIFNFGVGYDVRTPLLNQLASEHHGTTTYVEPNENLELALTNFYNKMVSPVLTHVSLTFKGIEVNRLYPKEINDLFAGSELIVLGRFTHSDQGQVILSGNSGHKTESFSYPLDWSNLTTENTYLPRLWAGRRIGGILENIAQKGENKENKDEVIALSKQYGIITPYTSFLALESDHRRSRLDTNGIQNDKSAYAPSASAPLGSMDNLKSESGSRSVRAYKAMGKIQQQSNAQDLEEAQGFGGNNSPAILVKTLGSKTFIQSNGVWTDAEYDKIKQGVPKQVTFGTDEYFRLISLKSEYAQYFSIGKQLIIVLDGTAYEVILPKNS